MHLVLPNRCPIRDDVMASRDPLQRSRLFVRRVVVPALGLWIGVALGSMSVMAIDAASNFDLADTNHDHRISREEFDGLTEAIPNLMGCFDEMDRNSDGYITRDEWSLTPDAREATCQRDGF